MVVSGTELIVSRRAATRAISSIKSAKELIANGWKAAGTAAWMGIRVISRNDKASSGRRTANKAECYPDLAALSGEHRK